MDTHLDPVEARIEGNHIYLMGHVDERTKPDTWDRLLAPILDSKTTVYLNWEGVVMMNSSGLLEWLRFSHSHNFPFVYEAAPSWLVGLFNSVGSFFQRPNIGITSMVVPYYDTQIDDSDMVLMQVGEDIPLLASYEGFDGMSLLKNRPLYADREVEPDFDPVRYFRFLAAQHQQFEAILKSLKG